MEFHEEFFPSTSQSKIELELRYKVQWFSAPYANTPNFIKNMKFAHGGDNKWAWLWKTCTKIIISVFGEYFSAEFFDYEILKKNFFNQPS